MGKGSKKRKRTEMECWQDQWMKQVGKFMDFTSCLYLLYILVLLPLYSHWDYRDIGSSKVECLWFGCKWYSRALFAGWTVLLLLALCKDGKGRKLGVRLTAWLRTQCSSTDWMVAGYGLATLLSYFCSDYRSVSYMGNSGWGMGMLVQLTFVGSYFALSRFWKKRVWMLAAALPATAILYFLGYCNRFGLYPIPMKTAISPEFISLVGNINWYCGYMILPLFAVAYLAWNLDRKERKLAYVLDLYLFLGFLALTTNGSSSGYLVLVGIFFALFLFSVRDAEGLSSYCRLVTVLSLSCFVTLLIRLVFPDAITYRGGLMDLFTLSVLPVLLLLCALLLRLLCRKWMQKGGYPGKAFALLAKLSAVGLAMAFLVTVGLIVANTMHPGSIGPLSAYGFFTFSNEWGSLRGAAWKTSLMLWKDLSPFQKLVGIGPDCIKEHLLYGADRDIYEFARSIWPSANLSNAHMEWLTVLIQEGVLGAVSFIGLEVTAIYRYLKTSRERSLSSCLIGACGLAVLAYLIHGLVSFQQVLNGPTMFVLLGVGEGYYREWKKESAG